MDYRRILTIQDVSCVGKCSITAALPVLAACGHEVSVLPTAVLSAHTGGFGTPAVQSLTDWMPRAGRHWAEQGITFDGILVGYLGSAEAIRYALEIAEQTLVPGGKLIVDPAMADNGRLYAGLGTSYPAAIKALTQKADALLPNVTEGAMLAGLPYQDSCDGAYIRRILNALNGKNVILTGASPTPGQSGAAVGTKEGIFFLRHRRIDGTFSGTGDLFAACFTAGWMGGMGICQAAELAGEFTCRCLEYTVSSPGQWRGVRFEPVLPWLSAQLN